MKCIGVGVLESDVDVECVGEHVIVADCYNDRVCVFSLSSGELVRTFGSEGTADGQFNYPNALAVVNSRLYVLDERNPRVQVFE